jgi:hypothetical protein
MTRLALTLFFIVCSSTASANAMLANQEAESNAKQTRTAEIQMVGEGREYNDITEYDIAVDGEQVTVAIGANRTGGQVALYDDDGALVVGYRFSSRHMIIYDSDGLVSHGAPDELGLDVMQEYGTAPMLLTDPVVLSKFVSSSGDGASDVKWNSIFDASAVMGLSCVGVVNEDARLGRQGVYAFDWTCP